jgi:hypothetical protein
LCNFLKTSIEQTHVNIKETSAHCFLVIPLGELLLILEYFLKMLLGIFSNLTASMTIENGKKGLVLVKVKVRNMCVFLIKIINGVLTMLSLQPCISAAKYLMPTCLFSPS